MTLQEWLETTCGCREVIPVRVTIGRTVYEGCRYKQDRKASPGSRAAREGRGDYVQEAIYLLGGLPASYRRSRRLAFVIDGDEREWFVASWVTAKTAGTGAFAKFHFEGNPAFQIMPWSADSQIDQYEDRPYERKQIEVLEAATV